MALSIDEIMERSVRKAVAEATLPLIKQVTKLEKAIAELSAMAKATNETFDTRERLITVKEASVRLGINAAKLRKLILSGDVRTAETPNGRRKVVESSVNRYIQGLQEKGAMA